MSILINKDFVCFSAPSLCDCAPPLQLDWTWLLYSTTI